MKDQPVKIDYICILTFQLQNNTSTDNMLEVWAISRERTCGWMYAGLACEYSGVQAYKFLGGACYWRKFYVSKSGLGLTIKTS